MRIESQPTLEPAPAPRRRWHLGRWFIVAMLAFGGYGAWREHDFRAAVKEAQALGWEWTYDDPFEAIQKDWKAAFRKATWSDGKRELVIPKAAKFAPHAPLVRRLAPKYLALGGGGPELKDLSALKGLPALRDLYLGSCTGLTNVDALRGIPALQALNLMGCTGLTNVDALSGLTALQWLNLSGCTGLTNVDALKRLPALRRLSLSGCAGLTNLDVLKGFPALQSLNLGRCTGLTNLDALKGLPALEEIVLLGSTRLTSVDGLKGLPALRGLDLRDCTGLTNVDALKGLPALRWLHLYGCTNLSAEANAALKASLPNTEIRADGWYR